jgi:hypothetical protein
MKIHFYNINVQISFLILFTFMWKKLSLKRGIFIFVRFEWTYKKTLDWGTHHINLLIKKKKLIIKIELIFEKIYESLESNINSNTPSIY